MIPQAALRPGVQSDDADHVALRTAADAALRERDYASAARALRRILSVEPDDVRLLLNLGGALRELGQFEEALPVLARAVTLDPRRYGAWSNLGSVSLELQRYDDAIAAFSNAIRLKADHAPALSGLGVTLRRRGLPRQALAFFDLAVAATPGDPDLRTWRAMALLAAGDYPRGFAEYEWRLHASNVSPGVPDAPRWKGEPLAGRTLLVHGDGGLGDCLQFCRYIPMLRGLDRRVVVQVPRPLLRLLSRLPGIDGIVSGEEPPPMFDLACSVMSLPYILRTTIDSVPCAGGYLAADPVIVARWREVVDQDVARWRKRHEIDEGAPLKVGLVWSGGKRPWHLENTLIDRRRSIAVSGLAPLARAGEHVLFYSLQLGDPQAGAESPPPDLHLVDHTSRIQDFDDTAGLVSLLDLVIAVDTSTAHLAAALGRPVWLLSRYDQCWRWLSGRNDSPWYSTMRLYVQPAPFDWSTPVEQVAADLADLVRAGQHAGS